MLHWTYFRLSNIFSHFSDILSRRPKYNNNIGFYFRVHFECHPYISLCIASRAHRKEIEDTKNISKKNEGNNSRSHCLMLQHYRDLWVELLRYLFSRKEVILSEKILHGQRPLLGAWIWYRFRKYRWNKFGWNLFDSPRWQVNADLRFYKVLDE